MADSVLATFATGYFSEHLDKAYWTGLSADTKTAVLSMAKNDVTALLDYADPTCDSAYKAMCEQAVYLSRVYADQTEGKVVTGEGLPDLSQNYALIGKNAGISPRAEFFIQQAKKAQQGGSVRISRG